MWNTNGFRTLWSDLIWLWLVHWVWEKSCELRYECRIILVLVDEFFFFLLIFKFWYSVLEHSMRQLKSLLLKLKSPASVWKFNYYYYYFEVKKIIRLFFEKPWLPFIIKKKKEAKWRSTKLEQPYLTVDSACRFPHLTPLALVWVKPS